MIKLYFFIIFYCLTKFGFAQDPIFVNASEVGNGIGFQRLGESFILTPAHVVESTSKTITLSDERKATFKANLLESYANDIAILRVEDSKTSYLPLTLHENYAAAIANASTGFVTYLDVLGIVNYIHVNITSKDPSSFTVTPQSNAHTFGKGMSGSPFYIMYNDVKVLAGMLMSLEEGATDAFVYQFDDIITSISSFIETTAKTKLKLGLVWQTQNAEDVSILNRVSSALQELDNYTIISRVPERNYIDKHFEDIQRGIAINSIPKKLKNTIDVLVFGNISITATTNSNDMAIVNIKFESAIYNSSDFSLVKTITITTKGLGYKTSSAKEQAIKSLLTKLKDRFYEN